MAQTAELTKKQKAVIKTSDRIFAENGLTTYTAMEEALYGALTAAQEAVEMGKQLCHQIDVLEKRVKLLSDGAIAEEPDATDH